MRRFFLHVGATVVTLSAFVLSRGDAFASNEKTVLTAVHSQNAIVVDGEVSDPIWAHAPAYPLKAAWRYRGEHTPLSEGGTIKLAWDARYLYVAAWMEDSDVVAEGQNDNEHHYMTGDVLEVFLKPHGARCYWELYGTPAAHKTVFFYPARGRAVLPSSARSDFDLKVAASVEGTINDWHDRDKGWKVMLAIPLDALRKIGGPLDPESPEWSILVSRYNYSAYHEVMGGELSAVIPSRGDSDFHRYERWTLLRLAK